MGANPPLERFAVNFSGLNVLQIQKLKESLNIQTTLSLHYIQYKSGSLKEVIQKGYITQDGNGDLKKEIINLVTGSVGHTVIRLIYKTWPEKEPTIKLIKYEQQTTNHQ